MKRFPSTEWSGPAWYRLDSKEQVWHLVYFKPIDLGTVTATEFEGDDLLKVMREVQKQVDISGCYQGIIHSHHNMGAYHSGTDDQELKDGANNVGYPSLVVAHKKALHAFKWSYVDQFDEVHLVDGDVKVEVPKVKPEKRWVDEADAIEKAAKNKPKVTSIGYYNGKFTQGALWNDSKSKYNGWGHEWGISDEEVAYNAEYEKMENATKLFESGKMTKKKYEKRMKKWREFESDHFGVL